MTATYASLDLDAQRREEETPDGIEITLKGHTFVAPAELPLDVFDPFFEDDFDLGGILKGLLDAPDDTPIQSQVLTLLIDNPRLPATAWKSIHKALENLLDEEGYKEFRAARPSLKDTARLVKGLFAMYGTSLGEAFASAESSESDRPTSKVTSSSTTESTPAESGADESPAAEAAPASSE